MDFRTQLAIDYHGAELSAQPEPVSITLYRFLQEALTNVARHAAAEQGYVVLDHDAEMIRLSVRDDGQGFDAKTLVSPPGSGLGMGLAGMCERVDALDGRLEIDSQPGQGTHLSAVIPLLDEHAEL